MRRNNLSAVIFMLAVISLYSQEKDAGLIKALNNIKGSVLKAQLGFLASDHMYGSQLQMSGVAPGGDSARLHVAGCACLWVQVMSSE
jgi:hypothetical protein